MAIFWTEASVFIKYYGRTPQITSYVYRNLVKYYYLLLKIKIWELPTFQSVFRL